MCQRRRAVRRIANFPGWSVITRSYALMHARENRHSHDALIAGRRFLPRHINQFNQLITCPTHTTHSHAPSRQYNCTMGNKTICIMEIPQSKTKRSLYNSISCATDYCALSLHSTCIHRRSLGEARALHPKKILLASLWGRGHMPPQNFYRIHNDLESLFEKKKQFLQNLFKIFKNL